MSSRHILSGAVLGSQCEPLDSTPRPTWSYSYLYSPHEDHKDTLHHAPLVNSLNVTALNLHVLVTLGLEGSLESREARGALPHRGSGALGGVQPRLRPRPIDKKRLVSGINGRKWAKIGDFCSCPDRLLGWVLCTLLPKQVIHILLYHVLWSTPCHCDGQIK